MTDKPKPGKDKDLRYIRLAIEETDHLFQLLGVNQAESVMDGYVEFTTQAMLLTLDQLDHLDQMLSDPKQTPYLVIDYNRQMRDLCKTMLRMELTIHERQILLNLIQALGNQLRALFIIKEIRTSG
jgi:hypothetical protein